MPLLGCSSHSPVEQLGLWADQSGQGCGTHQHVCGLGLVAKQTGLGPALAGACESQNECGAGWAKYSMACVT